MEYRYTVFPSPFGNIHLLAGDEGLVAVGLNQTYADFLKQNQNRAPGEWKKAAPEEDEVLARATRSLHGYFHGGLPLSNDIPLAMAGTPFQLRVWNALRKIPHGKTLSYGEIADKIGLSGGARAVGNACGSNPLPLFVPCHRVLQSDGSLGGFGGGLGLKQLLLKHEGRA